MVASRAEVLQVLMAIRAHDVISLDRITARCALAVFHELTLFKGDLKLLFVTVDLQQRRTKQAVRDDAQQRNESDNRPEVPHRSAHVCVTRNPDDAKNVENHQADDDHG